MSEIELFVLGAPRIERGGVVVEVDTRKAIALVAYLAVEGQSFRRDSLAGLLWPEHDSTQARGALRRTLSTLKKAMGGEGIVADRATVGLAPNSVTTDAVTFRELVEASAAPFEAGDREESHSRLERAVKLYRGDFMAGFSLRDSVDFEDWQYYQAESHKRLMATALERLVECLAAKQQYGRAIENAHRWLALDPLHEPAHRKLMLLYAWNDQRAGALKQYRECVAWLDRELGVPPLEATTELYRQITDNDIPAPELTELAGEPTSIAADEIVASSPIPMVGRNAELSILAQAHGSIANSGRVVLVDGEAGIGKSRLVEEFLARAERSGAPIAIARCHSEETQLPFGAVTELMRSALESRGLTWLDEVPRHWLTECARLLPELLGLNLEIPAPAPLDDPGAQARFLEGIACFLAAAARSSAPGVLLVDDIYWADESSMDALFYLAGRLKGRPLLLLATTRTEEPLGGSRARRLLSADRSAQQVHVVLDRLTRAEVTELVAAVGKGDVGLSDRLFEETEGLPFFLVEYLAALEGGADPESPLWSAPSGVRELISSRLERLSEPTLQVLTTAAVIGRSFDFDTVREAGGRSEDETVSALDELTSGGFVREMSAVGDRSARGEPVLSTPLFDFSHEGIRRIVLDGTSSARRRLLHRRVGDSLARSRKRSSAEPVVVAQHYESAGDAATAAVYYVAAGDRARSLFAHAEALSHYRAALGLDHPEPSGIHQAIADVSVLTGDYGSALTSYETAAALSDQHDLVGIEHKIGTVHQRRGDINAARAHLEVALELTDDKEDGRRARVLADLSLTAHRAGDPATAERLAGEALRFAGGAGELDALAQVHNILGILAKSRGDLTSALEHLQRSTDLSSELSDPTARIAALNNLALARGETGDRDAAIAMLEEALKLSAELQDRHREAALENNLADLWHQENDRERSMDHLKRAVAIFAEIGSKESTMQPEIWKLVEW